MDTEEKIEEKPTTKFKPKMVVDPRTEQKEIAAARAALEDHSAAAKKALEGLQQLERGQLGIHQFRDLNTALKGFPLAKKAVELGRKIVKRRLQDELNDSTIPISDKIRWGSKE